MKKIIFICIVISQMILIVILIRSVMSKVGNNAKPSVDSISKKGIVFTPSDKLKYYYEPEANTVAKTTASGLESTNTINSDTLDERFEYSPEKPDGVFRIITLGDSFTYALYVDTKDNWTEVLEDKLNQEMKCSNIRKFEVINLGVQGFDTMYEVERYRVRGQKYNPDIVLWYVVDLDRINEEFRGKFNVLYAPYERNKDLDPLKKVEIAGEIFSKSRDEVLKKYGKKAVLDYQGKAFKLLRSYFKGPVVVVPTPNISKEYLDFLIKQAQNDGYYYYGDVRNYSRMGGVFKNNIHPNPKGHKIIAEDIFDYLTKKHLIPCK